MMGNSPSLLSLKYWIKLSGLFSLIQDLKCSTQRTILSWADTFSQRKIHAAAWIL
ncbi:Uncharacterised protein [Metakosakonia massiliensis]|uniref:Uncharacterized protein n=1 Tax=Phytobacter massiliensis TaxID=1485952 RepID=A0A6N3HR02_9ENTR